MSGELESYPRGLDLNTPNAQELINWSCKLTLYQRERDGGGGQPPIKSEVRAQSNKVGRLWFWGDRCSRISGGTAEARSCLCVCRASFLMTFAMSGVPLAGSRHSRHCMHFFHNFCLCMLISGTKANKPSHYLLPCMLLFV